MKTTAFGWGPGCMLFGHQGLSLPETPYPNALTHASVKASALQKALCQRAGRLLSSRLSFRWGLTNLSKMSPGLVKPYPNQFSLLPQSSKH